MGYEDPVDDPLRAVYSATFTVMGAVLLLVSGIDFLVDPDHRAISVPLMIGGLTGILWNGSKIFERTDS